MDTTTKIKKILKDNMIYKNVLAENLGISRPTLNSRLSGKSEWKPLEVQFIDNLYEIG